MLIDGFLSYGVYSRAKVGDGVPLIRVNNITNAKWSSIKCSV